MKEPKDYKKILYLAKKLKAVQYLGGKCISCGEENIFKLCFHHIDMSSKDYTISSVKSCRWSIIEKELDKCELRCQNCHHELHCNNDKINRYKKNKKFYLEYKGVSGCEKCGYNESLSSLDFHHIESNEKDFIMSEINISYKNLEDLTNNIIEELEKCVVLCKNCHRLEHSSVEFYEKHKDEIILKSNNIKEKQEKIDRLKVKELYYNGMKQIEIAKYFNASNGTISEIIKKLKSESI